MILVLFDKEDAKYWNLPNPTDTDWVMFTDVQLNMYDVSIAHDSWMDGG